MLAVVAVRAIVSAEGRERRFVSVSVDDSVASVGRIKVVQNGRPRFISFDRATVIDVSRGGITVNPAGMKAMLVCREEDLQAAEPTLEQTPASQASGELQAEANKPLPDFEPGGAVPPAGTVVPITRVKRPEPRPEDVRAAARSSEPEGEIPVTGAVEKPKPKPKPRARKKPAVKKDDGEQPAIRSKKTPKPRRRRER